ncbi:MAG TPA: hypothetical protein VN285_12870, partial [Candidatus Deferrimicrobium sp.]|nr:hypothetical protein [Candidatus Deferrimicrobium sp.]
MARILTNGVLGLLIWFTGTSLYAAPGDTVMSLPAPACCPQGLALDGHYLWCVDRGTDMIYKIDPTNGAAIDSIVAPGYLPRGLTWDGQRLWCVDAEEPLIFAVNPATRIVERTLYCPVTDPTGLAWDGDELWIADDADNKIHRISPDDGTTIVTIPSPSPQPCGLAFDGTHLWVSDRTKDMIYMVTPDRGTVILSLKAPGPHSWGLARDGSHVWNVDYQTDRIYKIIVDDGAKYSRLSEKSQRLEFTHQVRNFGPDSVKSLDVYLAIPPNRDNQELLAPVTFEPQPFETLSDKWGQPVAHFKFASLAPGKFTPVTIVSTARIYQTRYFIFPDKVGTKNDIPKDIRDKYLVDDTKFALN